MTKCCSIDTSASKNKDIPHRHRWQKVNTLGLKQVQIGNGLQALAPAQPQIGFLIISSVFFVLSGRAEDNNDQKEFGVKTSGNSGQQKIQANDSLPLSSTAIKFFLPKSWQLLKQPFLFSTPSAITSREP